MSGVVLLSLASVLVWGFGPGVKLTTCPCTAEDGLGLYGKPQADLEPGRAVSHIPFFETTDNYMYSRGGEVDSLAASGGLFAHVRSASLLSMVAFLIPTMAAGCRSIQHRRRVDVQEARRRYHRR